jgi:outer membrane biosynthesis protein TonB
MVHPRKGPGSLRFSRLETSRLLLALLISLLVHLVVGSGYLAGKKFGWWQKMHWPAAHKTALRLPKPVPPPVEPVIYLDVSQADAEAPKQAKYYSDKNSRAANPDVTVESNQPKLDGKQKDMPQTEDVPKLVKAKPAENSAATGLHPGTSQPGKPADSTNPDQQPKPRPRTVREAMEQQDKSPSLQMQQDGGVRRRDIKPSFDALATPFGDYDRQIVDAIKQRWYDLLDSRQFASDRTGKATVFFHLNPDGSVSELKITDNSVGEMLGYVCQEAIQQAAPFGAWKSDMRRLVGTNFREITFTFYYY